MINFQNIFCIILLIAFLIILAIYGPRFKIMAVTSEEFTSKCALRDIKDINGDNIGVKFKGFSWFFFMLEDLKQTEKGFSINKKLCELKGISFDEMVNNT